MIFVLILQDKKLKSFGFAAIEIFLVAQCTKIKRFCKVDMDHCVG